MFAGFLDTIILLGALQGFIIASLLVFTKKQRLLNRLLGALIFFAALACLDVYLTDQKWYNSNAVFQFVDAIVPLIVVMPIGPLLYFYIQASLDPNFVLAKTQRWSFYAVIIDLIPKIFAIAIIIGALLK